MPERTSGRIVRLGVTTHFKDEQPSTTSRQLLEEGVDVFIRFNEGLAILKKVVGVEKQKNLYLYRPLVSEADCVQTERDRKSVV